MHGGSREPVTSKRAFGRGHFYESFSILKSTRQHQEWIVARPMLPTILIVDDESMLLELYQAALAENYKVLIAENINHARDLLVENRVHAVVTDLNCGNDNGLDLLRWIQENQPTLFPSCLLMTGDSMADTDDISVKVICKPIDVEELLFACQSIIDS